MAFSADQRRTRILFIHVNQQGQKKRNKEYTEFREAPYRHSDADVRGHIQRKEQPQIFLRAFPCLIQSTARRSRRENVFQWKKYLCRFD